MALLNREINTGVADPKMRARLVEWGLHRSQVRPPSEVAAALNHEAELFRRHLPLAARPPWNQRWVCALSSWRSNVVSGQ